MRTLHYNPSKLEVDFAKAFEGFAPELESKLTNAKVVETTSEYDIDNPKVTYKLKDKEGDMHEIVVQVIQRPDTRVK
jgi:hypothetical protein